MYGRAYGSTETCRFVHHALLTTTMVVGGFVVDPVFLFVVVLAGFFEEARQEEHTREIKVLQEGTSHIEIDWQRFPLKVIGLCNFVSFV